MASISLLIIAALILLVFSTLFTAGIVIAFLYLMDK